MRMRWIFVLVIVGTAAVAAPRSRVRESGPGAPDAVASGPMVVMDTTGGRVTCKLFVKEAPVTVARFVGLAEGTVDWTDAATGKVMHGVPFYDATGLKGVSDGVSGGDRVGLKKGAAGPAVVAEKNGLLADRAGRLLMAEAPAAAGVAAAGGAAGAAAMESSSMFVVLDHANAEYDGGVAVVFGQCDEASVALVHRMSHELRVVDNHPAAVVGIDHVSVVREGEKMPAVAKAAAAKDVAPALTPMPAMGGPEPTGPQVAIETSMGTLSCRLFEETAVGTANFIGLANGTKDWKMPATHAVMHGVKFYEGLIFARVIPDFMVQNADLPGLKDDDGDIGFQFANEIVPGLTFDRPGRLAYANGGPGTNTSEFFVTEHPVHRLDGLYEIFGQCDEASVKVVERIARVERDVHNKPVTAVVIKKVTVVGVR